MQDIDSIGRWASNKASKIAVGGQPKESYLLLINKRSRRAILIQLILTSRPSHMSSSGNAILAILYRSRVKGAKESERQRKREVKQLVDLLRAIDKRYELPPSNSSGQSNLDRAENFRSSWISV